MRLLVWGISGTLKELEKRQFLLDDSFVYLYADSDEKWRGSTYRGREVIAPSEIEKRRDYYDYILISTARYQDEMLQYAKEQGFADRLLPLEIIYPSIELHFNEMLDKWIHSEKVSIVKNWYVERNNRSIIIKLNGLSERKVDIRLFPKWCFGNRDIKMRYCVTNLQDMRVLAEGDYALEENIPVDVDSNVALIKITTTGLNSSFVLFNIGKEAEEEKNIKHNALLAEHSYNYDFKWHEFDYEFLSYMQWAEKYTILDVGANLGQSAENFLEHTDADVVFIEANPSYKEILEALQIRNGDRARFISAGVGVSESMLSFYIPKFEEETAQESSFLMERAAVRIRNMLGVDITENNWQEYIKKIEVKVVPIDVLLDSYRYPVFFVKIDVENYELEAIKGMKKTIERYRPIILLEFNTQEQQREIIKFVNQIGSYKIKYWDYINSNFADENVCCSLNYFLLPERMLQYDKYAE